LWPLKPLIKGECDLKRLALTIARSYEQIRLEIDYKTTDPITAVNSEEVQKTLCDLDKKFGRFLELFIRKYKWYLGVFTDPIKPWSRVSTTLTKGPNGPAVACSHLDAKAVVQNPELVSSLEKLNSALGQDWITYWMLVQARLCTHEGTNLHTGRLGFSAEPAGKTRIFAIGDYWSQLSLKPIQIALYKTLCSIRMDATSDQDKGFKTLIEESKGHPTYCIDLSSASDRIPATLQKHRLRLMMNQDVADSWHAVMTQRDFYIKTTKQNVRWEVGQPLGLLSSFPSFALWHHDIIQFAANWENFHKGKPLKLFKQYRLLGDDVVIFNTEVARRYQWLLERINIPINMQKSVIGDKEASQIEFAKRLSLRGKEMSSIKHNILSKNHILDMLDLVEILGKRDFISITDTDHYGLHQILKSKDLQHLEYLIWLRFSSSPTFYCRSDELRINRDDIIRRIRSIRSKVMIEKVMATKYLHVDDLFPLLKRNFTTMGVSCNEKTLANRDIEYFFGTPIMRDLPSNFPESILSNTHPIVLALNQTYLEQQNIKFTVLDDLNPDTVSPVEYLPIVSCKSYFHSRTTINRYLSKILLACLKDALDEQRSQRL